MSYSFTVPADGGHCTAETFDKTAEDVLERYLTTWADGDQKTATRHAAEQALEVAAAAVDPPGIVGDTFRVDVSGHANPPGTPAGVGFPAWVQIRISGVPLPAAAGEDAGRFDAATSDVAGAGEATTER